MSCDGVQDNRSLLSEHAVRKIRQIIVQDGLKPNALLDSEDKLSRRLGLSRTVVRDAVRYLSAKGVLETRRGKGTVVTTPLLAPDYEEIELLVHFDRRWLRELTELRSVIELGIAEAVIERITTEQLERMTAAIFKTREKLDRGEFDVRDEDLEFHLAYLAGSANRAVEGHGKVLRRFFAEIEFAPVNRTKEMVQRTIDEHLRIQNAIIHSDVESLRTVLRTHLNRRLDTYLKEV